MGNNNLKLKDALHDFITHDGLLTRNAEVIKDLYTEKDGNYEILESNLDNPQDNEDREAIVRFVNIARCILHGHFEVKPLGDANPEDIVRVLPTIVELYYHEEEKDIINRTEDFIVYHRNKYNKTEKIEPFPEGALHNHVSGVDITFEHPDGKFRGSALIRGFRFDKKGLPDKIIGIKEKETRSTYLYGALYSQFNIFDGFSVLWVDGNQNTSNKIFCHERTNVYEMDEKRKKTVANPPNMEESNVEEKSNKKKDEYIPDKRKWQFSLDTTDGKQQ